MLHEAYMKHKKQFPDPNDSEEMDVYNSYDDEEKRDARKERDRSSYCLSSNARFRHGRRPQRLRMYTFKFYESTKKGRERDQFKAATASASDSSRPDRHAASELSSPMFAFDIPMEANHFCSIDFWNFFCLFGLPVDECWRFSEPTSSCFSTCFSFHFLILLSFSLYPFSFLLADFNFRYVPVLQKLYYKNFSFYSLAGKPGCVSFELPEPVGNMWRKKSIWRR